MHAPCLPAAPRTSGPLRLSHHLPPLPALHDCYPQRPTQPSLHPPVDTTLALALPEDCSAMAKSGSSLLAPLPVPPLPLPGAAGAGAGALPPCSSLRFAGAGTGAGREETDTAGWLAVAMMVVKGESASGWSTPAEGKRAGWDGCNCVLSNTAHPMGCSRPAALGRRSQQHSYGTVLVQLWPTHAPRGRAATGASTSKGGGSLVRLSAQPSCCPAAGSLSEAC